MFILYFSKKINNGNIKKFKNNNKRDNKELLQQQQQLVGKRTQKL